MTLLLAMSLTLIGFKNYKREFLIVLTVTIALIVLTTNPYLKNKISGLIGVVMFAAAASSGAVMDEHEEMVGYILLGILLAAVLNANLGILQWFDLTGELSRWIATPEGSGVAYGAFRQKNLYATFMCIGAISLITLHVQNKITKNMTNLLLVLFMFAIATSASRVGFLEIFALTIFVLLNKRRMNSEIVKLCIFQLIILLIAVIVMHLVANVMNLEFESGFTRMAKIRQDSRVQIWGDGLAMFMEHPFKGWGWGEMVYGHYYMGFDNRGDGLLDNAHNLIIHLMVVFGVFVIPVILYFVKYLRRHVKLRYEKNNDFSYVGGRYFGFAAESILIVLVLVHSMLEYPLWNIGFICIFGWCFGYLFSPLVVGVDFVKGFKISLNINYVLMAVIFFGGISILCQFQRVSKIFEIPFSGNADFRNYMVREKLKEIGQNWYFQEQLDYIFLNATDLKMENSVEIKNLSRKLMHFSPDPRVFKKLILSLQILKNEAALQVELQRFRKIYPNAYDVWINSELAPDLAGEFSIL